MKARILRISTKVLLDLFGPGFHPAYECTKSPLPKDAKVTAVQVNFENPDEILLRIESEEYSEIRPNQRLPFCDPPEFTKKGW